MLSNDLRKLRVLAHQSIPGLWGLDEGNPVASVQTDNVEPQYTIDAELVKKGLPLSRRIA